MTSNNSIFKKLIKSTGFSFIALVISTGFKFLTQIVLAWMLGARVFGLYTLGMVIYQFGELIARLGLESGAVRYVSIHYGAEDNQKLKGILIQSLGLPFFSGIILGTLMFLGAEPIAQNVFNKPDLAIVLQIFAVAIPFGASMTVGAFATTGFQVSKYKVTLWDVLLPGLNLILATILCLLGWGLRGASLAWLATLVIALVITAYCIYKIFPDLSNFKIQAIFETKQLLKFSLALSFGSFLWLVLLWTDALMLGLFRSEAEVGIYRAASQTALLMTLFTRSVVNLFSPMIAKLYSEQQLSDLEKLFQTASRWSFALTLPLFLFVVVSGKDVLHIFGAEFSQGWLPLAILAAGQLARAGPGGLSMHMLAMSGNQNLKLISDVILATLNVILNFLFIPRWGMLGAAIATGVSILLVNLLRSWQVSLVLHMQGFSKNYFKIAGAGIVTFVLAFGLNSWLVFMPFLLRMFLIGSVIFLVYGILFYLVCLEEVDRQMLTRFRKKKS